MDALCNLGSVLFRQDKPTEALPLLHEAIRLAPRYAQARNIIGGVLLALNQFEPAVQHLREAVRLDPKLAAAHSNLGIALEHLDRVDEAIQCFRESIRLDPEYSAAHNNLGSALKNLGKPAEALAEFKAVLRVDPNNNVALFNLSRLAAVGEYEFSDAELDNIQELTTRPNLAASDRARLHFALSAVLDKKAAYDEAFAHCRRANELTKEAYRLRGSTFDPAAHAERIDKLIAAYTPAYFERVRGFDRASCTSFGSDSDSDLPVFIVGMPRSGTSLAEQILASHPQVHGGGELSDIDLLVNAMTERVGDARSESTIYPQCIANLDAATAKSLAEAHVQRLQLMGGAATRVTDKAPFNFLHVGFLATLFPRARIIHCRRDPIDTCLSCYFQSFAVLYPFTLDLTHLGQYYRQYQRLMAHWAKVSPTPILELNYEELTADQETWSRRLIEFCGLEWDERCLRFHETPRVVRTFSALQVRQPMYRSAVGRWKRYEQHLQPLLAALEWNRG